MYPAKHKILTREGKVLTVSIEETLSYKDGVKSGIVFLSDKGKPFFLSFHSFSFIV